MKKLLSLLLILVLLAPAVCFAASPWTTNTTYSDKVTGKLSYGFTNLTLGWLDLFYEPHRYHVEKKNIFLGIGKGIFDLVGNTVGGALHTVTFFIPQIDVPIPDNGVHFDK